ncbi:molybdopterin-binding protein [Haloarcula salina]|uniref:Molybdenum cofactor biosynthesis protein n=1 Tax=Haloarcula salina TaxID=1429914 RepID=A0AA41KBV8_9EURY|nr:molybdopterin-binding protein [Haloarcula salina]MBV0901690.1 molybdenum cofactor biosynthesis protein [Haloarcula salina]
MVDSSPSDAETVSLEAARRELGRLAAPVDRTDRVPLSVAVGRVLAADATAAAPVDSADLAADETIFQTGRRIRPSDVGLLKAAGVNELRVRQRPQVGVVPTGDELDDAAGGDRAETAGFTLAQYVDRWGGKVTYRNPVADDAPALRMAVQRDLTRDAIAVTGTEPGDTLREVVADLGDVLTDRIAIAPGENTGLAVVEGRPVLLLPESPAGVRVGATQLLRPLVKTLAGAPLTPFPERHAELARDVDTDASHRTFVPVTVDGDEVTPIAGSDLGTVTRADGWMSIPPESDGPAVGTTATVENWDYLP